MSNAVDPRPNILLLCADDHRADAIGALGHPCVRTPHLDRLVREGTAFTRCYTTVPICTPARAELLSGRSAFRNGVRWFEEPLRPGLTLLPQALAAAGYATFFTGKWHNDAAPETRGYARTRRVFNGGMTLHEMCFEEENGTRAAGFSTDLFAEAAVGFIAAPPARPWFAHVAFTAPHDPRTPPARWRYDPATVPLPENFLPEHPFDNGEMTIRDEQLEAWPRTPAAIRGHLADYYGMISHLDEGVGRILAALEESGQAERTLVVYTGDHGLAIGSHGLMGKENLYEHSVRVPLLLRGPGVPHDRRQPALCHGYDLMPTLCALAGAPVPDDLDGRSLVDLLSGLRHAHRDSVFGAYRDVQRMVCTGRWKLIEYPHAGRRQLFDLETDPHELRDLLRPWRYAATEWFSPSSDGEEFARIARRLRQRLRVWQGEVNDPLLPVANRARYDR